MKTKTVIPLIAAIAAAVMVIIGFTSCKKNNSQPITTQTSTPQASEPILDTTIAGNYRMIAANPTTEMSSLSLTLQYRSFKIATDTTKKIILYSLVSNTGNKGEVRISKNNIFKDSNLNTPYIEELDKKVIYGLISCQQITLGSNSRFSGDTLFVNYSLWLGGGTKALQCTYLKNR